jgi:hypothetical protein
MTPSPTIENLAPLKPLDALSETTNPTPTYTVDGVIELLKDKLDRDKDTFKEIANTSMITSNFIQGKQLWQRNYWNNSWQIRPINLADSSKISAINIMQFYCTAQIKMIVQSNPDIEPIDEYKQRRFKQQVKIAKAVWNRYERKFYTPWFNQQEALHAVCSGTYIESVEYDHLAQGAKVFKEIFGQKDIEIHPGYSKCFECDEEGGYGKFTQGPIPACPNCGSHDILPPEQPMNQQFTSVLGIEPVQMGDLVLSLKPIQAVRFDISKRFEESDWALYRQRIRRNKIAHLLGNIDLPITFVDDNGLDALREISRAGNTLAGKDSYASGEYREDDVTVDHLSVRAHDIAHIIPIKDEKTVDGQVIEGGKRLSEQYPNGGRFIILNEAHVIGFYPNVHHSDECSSGVYHMRLESGLGRGSEDTVEVQKRFNRFDAQNVRYMEVASTPGKTYIKGGVDRKHIKQIGNPGAVIPVNAEIAAQIGNRPVIENLQPGTMAAQFFSYTYDILNQYRQLTSHSTDFTGAFPGVDNKTATGAQITKSTAESAFSPMLQIKSEVRVGTAHKTFRQYKKNFQGVKQYVSMGITETNQEVGAMISGEDINTDIEFTIVRNSEQPKTPYDRQTDFANMMQVASQAGGILQVKQVDDRLYDTLLKTFDIDMDDNTYSTMSDVCEQRLENAFTIKSQFDQLTQLGQTTGIEIPEVPVEGLLMALDHPITVEEPNHIKKAKWFMDYMDCPLGFELSSDKRDVIRLFVRTHYQMEVQQQQAVAAGFAQVQQAGGGDPAVQTANIKAQTDLQKNQQNIEGQQELEKIRGENQLNNTMAKSGADAATQDEAHSNNVELEQTRAQNQQKMADKQQSHDIGMHNRQHQSQMALTEAQGDIQSKLQKEAPKPTSKSKK